MAQSWPTEAAGLTGPIPAAAAMEKKTLCTMSGLPADFAGDRMPNRVVSPWSPATQATLRGRRDPRLIPFWTAIARLAGKSSVERIALEGRGARMGIRARSRIYGRLGFGDGGEWWRQVCDRFRMAGDDGAPSFEHEDARLSSLGGLETSFALLQGVMPANPADDQPQDI